MRRPGDADAISEFVAALDLPLWGVLPWSDDVTDADRATLALIDVAPACPMVAAIRTVAVNVGVL